MSWHHLQYCIGLHRLGHDVWFVEDSEDYPSCYDPTTHATTTNPEYGLAYARSVFERVGVGTRWAYIDRHAGIRHGPAAGRVDELARTADVVLNLSGVNPLGDFAGVPARVLVDTDPAFTQVRHLTDRAAHQRAAMHTHFATFATSFGTPDCMLPDDGFDWHPTRQPLVADVWQVTPLPVAQRLTTVMQWESYPAVDFDGLHLGMKSASMTPLLDLPSRCPPGVCLELAVGGTTVPRAGLIGAGWHIEDPTLASRDPWTFQTYMRESFGEFSVAKQGYVATRSGWFSERSLGYLASGRPVITEDTAFSSWLPTGDGLLAYCDIDQAAAAIADVAAHPQRHARAARAVAVEHFDHRVVLADLLQLAGTASAGRPRSVEGRASDS